MTGCRRPLPRATGRRSGSQDMTEIDGGDDNYGQPARKRRKQAKDEESSGSEEESGDSDGFFACLGGFDVGSTTGRCSGNHNMTEYNGGVTSQHGSDANRRMMRRVRIR